MPKYCSGCGATRFHLSRFRTTDVPRLIFLQYPVRCYQCEQRSYAFVGWVMNMVRKKLLTHRARKSKVR